MSDASAQQLEAEQAAAESDDAKRAAEKRAAALGATDVEEAADAKPKRAKQTTR